MSEINVVVEIPKDSRIKYEIDPHRNSVCKSEALRLYGIEYIHVRIRTDKNRASTQFYERLFKKNGLQRHL